MSYSTIFGIRKDTTGENIEEFENSWLFIPVVWDLLSDKYLKDRRIVGYDPTTKEPIKESIIHNPSLYRTLDKMLMEDNIDINDRIVWELGCQNIFLVKDKNRIANAIRVFFEKEGEKLSDHIKERFNEMAGFIESIDENEYSYFVHKNSSCDDSVENWFYQYIEEEDDWEMTGKILDNTNSCRAYIVQFKDDLIDYEECEKYFKENI